MPRLPRLPVLGWRTFAGSSAVAAPSVLQRRHTRMTSSGRDALTLALRLLGIGTGHTVLVPTYHCPSMVAPVVQSGATPHFYALDERGAPDLSRADHFPPARAILVAHYFGFPQPMATVREFCDRRGMALIEDCAHAFFGIADGRPVGAWGDVAIASLSKFFPVLEGGVLASDHHLLDTLGMPPRTCYEELRAAANVLELGAHYGRLAGLNGGLRLLFQARAAAAALPAAVAGPSPAGAVPAGATPAQTPLPPLAVRCIARMARRRRIVQQRRTNFEHLGRLLRDCPGARPLHSALPPAVVPYVFPLLVEDPEASYTRLRHARVPLFRWDERAPGTSRIEGDVGGEWAHHVFQLPCHQDLGEADVEWIAAQVLAALQAA
ncbi:MAG: DegT/DnrJ/EryC1/StrS family aminotransferase [Betaproteobacteria bacterium]